VAAAAVVRAGHTRPRRGGPAVCRALGPLLRERRRLAEAGSTGGIELLLLLQTLVLALQAIAFALDSRRRCSWRANSSRNRVISSR
jgi:hypothetical protein